MASDMFLVIDGIKGESQDKVYGAKGGIDIQSFSWGIHNPTNCHTGGGGGAGKASFGSIGLSKSIDKSTCALQTELLVGKHIKEATLVMRKAGKSPLEFMTIKLSDVLVTSYSIGGSEGSPGLHEQITLDYTKIKCEYKEQDEKGGGKAAGDFGWNVKEGHKL